MSDNINPEDARLAWGRAPSGCGRDCGRLLPLLMDIMCARDWCRPDRPEQNTMEQFMVCPRRTNVMVDMIFKNEEWKAQARGGRFSFLNRFSFSESDTLQIVRHFFLRLHSEETKDVSGILEWWDSLPNQEQYMN